MRSLNKAQIIGHLGADPESRTTGSGQAVTNLRIATSESWTDKATGQRQERTEWHSVVLFRKLAEIAAQYLAKGSRVYIEGKLQTRKWTDSNGLDRYTTEIVADELLMLDSAQGSAGTRPQTTPRPSTSRQPPASAGAFNDDIPCSKRHWLED